MRLRDRILLTMFNIGGELLYRASDRHLTTDPVCVHYRAPRPGSRLDRASRGYSCGKCMTDRAFGRLPDGTIFTTFACIAGQHERCDRACDCECHAETPDHENRSER